MPKRIDAVLVVWMSAAIAFAVSSERARAHEPLFGLGPHTVGQYAWALESELERQNGGWSNRYELIYGLTPDLAMTASLPYVFSTAGRRAGLGDLIIRGKRRFLRHDVRNASTALAFHWGVKLPTGSQSARRGSGTTDYFVGLSFGRESRRHYAFADARYLVNGTSNQVNRGNILNIDAAYGIRPWKLEYLQPDAVFLLEVLGEVASRNTIQDRPDPDSGGFTLSVAPGFFFSYRNIMLKGGVKISVVDRLNGIQDKPDPEYVLAVEFHMPPFK